MKRWVVTGILFFWVLTTSCAYYNTFYNAQKFYKEAEKERKRREKTQVVELSPEEEAQLKRSGRSGLDQKNRASQTEMQNYQQAIERSYRVIEYFPNSSWNDDAVMMLAQCFFYRRDYNKALRKFDELMQLYPNSDFIDDARLLKAKTFIEQEEYDTAEEQLAQLSQDKKVRKYIREQAKYELGGLYYKKQNYQLAAENYQSSIQSADDKLIKAMALYRLGECFIRLKQYDEAPPVLRRAVKAAPNEDFRSQSMFKLGEAHSLNGEYDRAIKTYRNALAKEFDEKRIPRLKVELANNLRLKGELGEAIKWYEGIIEEHQRTDASARSYFALGEIEEYISEDYKKAKENYDLVRSEFSNSLIAPIAKERSDNIGTLLELQNEIARLEGRAVESDSLSGENGDGEEDVRDDGPINLSADGMWINYSGRDRPPPMSLRELTDADLARQARMQERVSEMLAAGDSTKIDSSLLAQAPLDSAALAERAAQEALEKEYQLSAKYLALGEVMLFAFDKPDSATKYYQIVVEKHQDSTHVARALYSLAYVYQNVYQDTLLTQRVLEELIEIFPETNHAEGARRMLGLELLSSRIDSAKVLFNQAETAIYQDNNLDRAFELWDTVVERFPDSPYAQKSAFAKAWHYENTLFQLDEAVAAYESLTVHYPQSQYIDQIKPKLAAVEKVRKEAEARQKAIADSLAALETAKLDSAATDSALVDSLQVPGIIDSLLVPVPADSMDALVDTLDTVPDTLLIQDEQTESPQFPETAEPGTITTPNDTTAISESEVKDSQPPEQPVESQDETEPQADEENAPAEEPPDDKIDEDPSDSNQKPPPENVPQR